MKSTRRLAKPSAKSKPAKSKPANSKPAKSKPAKSKPPARKAKSAVRKSARKRSGLGAPGPTAPGTPLIGQVAPFAFGFAPAGWLPCDGRLMSIMQNQPLFSLLGTTYGGNGVSTFALPKLKPVDSAGPGYFIAVQGSYPTR
jgi:hypothetical protein